MPPPTPPPDHLARLHRERRAQVRGLLFLALLAALFLLLRFGPHRLFIPGWWRL